MLVGIETSAVCIKLRTVSMEPGPVFSFFVCFCFGFAVLASATAYSFIRLFLLENNQRSFQLRQY